MNARFPVFPALLPFLLVACAPQVDRVSSVTPPPAPVWAFEGSDVPLDPAYRFGRLDNGMRYVIRHNATPQGTAMVRMEIAAGALDEAEDERGYAHFVEHMAFNGSTNVPEGEMVRLLERHGLAFGADTNAATGFDSTVYMLDLPRNDPALLDIALMLMRETASELTFDAEAVARERGVVLAERRDRMTWQFRNLEDQLNFINPGSRYTQRLPIGTEQALNAATTEHLRQFWRREYVPAQTTLVIVGDFAPDAVEAAIRARFSNWQAAPAEPQPDAGPIDFADSRRTDIYLDPAMTERVIASRHGPWIDGPDSIAQRREEVLRQIGYAIVNRRLLRITRQPDPPFRGAGLGTARIFKEGRTTNLIVDTVDGKWQPGLTAAVAEYRRALRDGFTAAEVAEQVANIRNAQRNEAQLADTRSNSALMQAVFALLRDDRVPTPPQGSLERLEAFIPQITPQAVLSALKREAVPLADPLLRFQGKAAPTGGEKALRAAWDAAMHARIARTGEVAAATFAYTDFGTPGAVASDTREPLLGIRTVRFANGVRLNLKRTEIERDRVLVQVEIDGGDRLATRDSPLATELVPFLPAGGLGKHSSDDLQTITAGRSVGVGLANTPETFASGTTTTVRDLEFQLQLMTAFLNDPGLRPEGEVQFRLQINNFFAQMNATPGAALTNAIGGILSDGDPRFTLQKPDDYRTLTFAGMRGPVLDRFGKGALEIGIVGDIDEDKAIALVAATLGTLPPREPEFGAYPEQRQRSFTADRSRRIVRHTGAPDQAMIRMTWPTRDDADPVDNRRFALLERVVRIRLTENLRERLGKAYSPTASSDLSRSYDGYGTFWVLASVDVHELAATRAAILETIADLRDAPISEDTLQRARQPLLEAYDNSLKSNRGWLSLVARAQSEADRIDRFTKARDRLAAITPAELQALARQYLGADRAVEVNVLPQGVDEPKP